MSAPLEETVVRLMAARRQLSEAVVTALRAQADVDESVSRYGAAAKGTNHPHIRQAIEAAKVGSDKTLRYARLLEEAREHLRKYLERIAPGSGADEPSPMPDGERLVQETESRARKGEAFLRKGTKSAGDMEDGAKQGDKITTATREMYRSLRQPPESTTTETAVPHPAFRPANNQSQQVDNPLTAIVMSTAAAAVGVKGIWESVKRTRERHRDAD